MLSETCINTASRAGRSEVGPRAFCPTLGVVVIGTNNLKVKAYVRLTYPRFWVDRHLAFVFSVLFRVS